MKEIKVTIDEQTFELIEEKANKWHVPIPEIAKEYLLVGVGA